MGCVLSKKDGNRNSMVFRVYNVDENGEKHNPGKIEITDTELILRQKGRDQITWPLRCLRRYGWEEELFSFESGRRCYTGPGIYAFKCKRAELLFKAVQESIMRVGQGDMSASQAFDHHGHSNSRPPSTIEMSDLMAFTVPNGNTGLASMREMNYINQTIVNEHEQHTYQNTAPLRANGSATSAADTASALIDFLHNPLQTDPKLNYIDPDFPTSTESLTNINLSVNGQASGSRQDQTNTKKRIDSEPGARYPLIDVVDCDETNEVFMEDSAFETERLAEYMNVGPLNEAVGGWFEPKPVVPPPPLIREPEYTNINPKNPPQLNYIQVGPGNFSNSKTSTVVSPVVPSVPAATGGSYAEIDFHRTEALSNRQVLEQDEGSRKTRHNSTISSAF
jgi:fibroblast growth factor receptor substrate 2